MSFETSLGYVVSLKPVWDIVRPCLNYACAHTHTLVIDYLMQGISVHFEAFQFLRKDTNIALSFPS